MNVILGQIFALIVAACWGHNSIVYSIAGKRVGSQTVTHIRLWVALPIIFIVHLVFTGRFLPFGFSTQVYLYLIISGLIGFFLADLCIFAAFVKLSPRETMVIMTLSPIFAAGISWVAFNEILVWVQIIGILITISGITWVIFGKGIKQKHAQKNQLHDTRGILYAFTGSFLQAVGMVLAKAGLSAGIHPVSGNLIRISAGLTGLIAFALIRRSFRQDFKKMADRKAFFLIAFGAVIGPVLGIVLTLYALSWAPVGIVTTLMQTTPILLLPVDRFVFKKKLTTGAVMGTIMAIAGAAFLFLTA